MARRAPFRRRSSSGRFSRYIASRRVLTRQVHATTPVRFLRRLNLLPANAEQEPVSWDVSDSWFEAPVVDSGLPAFDTRDAAEAVRPAAATSPADAESLAVGHPVFHEELPEQLQRTVRSPEISFRRGIRMQPDRPLQADALRRTQVRPLDSTEQLDDAAAVMSIADSDSRPARALPAHIVEDVAIGPETAALVIPLNKDEVALQLGDALASSPNVTHQSDAREDERRAGEAAVPFPAVPVDSTEPQRVDATYSIAREERLSVAASQQRPSLLPPSTSVSSDRKVDVDRMHLPDAALQTPLVIEKSREIVADAVPDAPIADQRISAAAVEPVHHMSDVRVDEAHSAAIASNSAVHEREQHTAVDDDCGAPRTLTAQSPRATEAGSPTAHAPSRLPLRRARRAHVEEFHRERSSPTGDPTINQGKSDAQRRARSVNDPAESTRRISVQQSAEESAATLFQTSADQDLSPAAWAARLASFLRGPVKPAAGQHPRPAMPVSPSGDRKKTEKVRVAGDRESRVHLSQHTRRLLTPLVGVDPDTVAVLQGPVPNEIASQRRADALAIGDETVVLRQSFRESSPADVGLLAHELTHIARRRQPRFVPPAARHRSARTALQYDAAVTLNDEEALALRVESHVRAVAPVTARSPGAPSADGADDGDESADAVSLPAFHEQPIVLSQPRATDQWGGLPAPWEPLPEWATSTPQPVPEASKAPIEAAPVRVVAPQTTTALANAPVVSAADESRTVETAVSESPAPTPDASASTSPDLDALARQVYAVLKRRLETEARREFMVRS